MEESYHWAGFVSQKLSRRGALRGGAIVGAGIALAGCSQPGATPTTAPVAVTAGAGAPAASPTAAGARAKYGGTITWLQTADGPHLDVHLTTGIVMFGWGPFIAYSKLLRFDASPA